MAKLIERLRYFDGEFLRSADLEQEQRYHIEMRRRLNRKLHMFGIAEGLMIANQEGAEDLNLKVFGVTPGFAIDWFGRELVVSNNLPFDDTLLSLNQVSTPGVYDVWLVYQENASTPPQIGMQNCAAGAADQYTRWQESCKIVLTPQTAQFPTKDDEFQNQPKAGMGGVPLGSVVVSSVSGRLLATGSQNQRRVKFVGLRGQRIELPNTPESYTLQDFLGGDSLHPGEGVNPRSWLTVQPNVQVQGNEAVGDDFLIDFDKNPKPTKPDAGNLKVSGNAFIKGTLYQLDGSIWRTLDEMIRARTPDVQLGIGHVDLAPAKNVANQTASGDVEVNLQSSVVDADKPQVLLAISGCLFQSKKKHKEWFTDIDDNAVMQVSLDNPQVAQTAPGNYKLTFKWFVGVYTNRAGNVDQDILLQKLTYSYAVVLKPKTA